MHSITIGRNPECDIVVSDSKVSGNHADVHIEDGILIFTDHSTNGTCINGTLVHNKQFAIMEGDSILLANCCNVSWNDIASHFDAMDKGKSSVGPHKRHLWILWISIALLISSAAVMAVILSKQEPASITNTIVDKPGYNSAISNYGDEIKRLSQKYDLSRDFLMALIMLESSGRKNVPPRFEKGIYKKLKEVQDGSRTLEGISRKDILDASDDAIRNLSSSWGPFQLMGYKCLHLNIHVSDLRGDKSLEHAVRWINDTYGDYIRKGRYKDAFHIHNTGQPVPKSGKYKTYDSSYIPRGLKYMEYFRKNFK